MTPEIGQGITTKLTQAHISVDGIRDVLREADLSFSDDSVRNIAYGLTIFKEIGGELFKEPFFIYGSTAKGTAGTEPKIQEVQFWKDVHFLGSTFRIYGMSDLDIRCVSEKPEGVFEIITRSKGNLSPFTLRPAGIRVESYESVRENITRRNASSFYRRVLFLNSPIVLSGREMLSSLTATGKDFLVQDDLDYEREMGEIRKLVRGRLEETSAIFLSAQELATKFPVYYSEASLMADNFQRTHSFKVSFSLRESSLVPVQISGRKEIEEYTRLVAQNPSIPLEELKKKKQRLVW